VLAIDADINQHLALTLGYPAETIEAMPGVRKALTRLKRPLAGSNPRIRLPETPMVKTTLPGSGSHLVRLRANDPVIDAFCARSRPYILSCAWEDSLNKTSEPAAFMLKPARQS
jgi:CO dehydrogenase maturation factor